MHTCRASRVPFLINRNTVIWHVPSVAGWLTADILSGLERWTPMQGSPQGAVISPLLANIYLDPLDRLMADHGHRMVWAHRVHGAVR